MGFFDPQSEEQLIEVAYKFLIHQKLKISKTIFSNRLKQHPDYQTLVSLMDVLDSFGIQNEAIQLNIEDIEYIKKDIPSSFFSYTNQNGGAFIYVSWHDGQNIEYFSLFTGFLKEDWDSFTKKWSGIVLAVDASEYIPEEQYNANVFFEKNEIITISLFVLVFILGFLALIYEQKTWMIPLLGLKFVGLCVSIIIVSYENNKNSIGKKICNSVKTTCKGILESRGAKIFGVLSWTELGAFYFFGGSLFLLGGLNDSDSTVSVLTLINIPTLIFSFYSLFYQKWIAREWCFFCLLTLLVFWIESIVLFFLSGGEMLKIGMSNLIWFVISFTFSLLVVLLLKSFLFTYNQFKAAKYFLVKLKANRNIFELLLYNDGNKYLPEVAAPLTFGAKESKTSITVVTSPSCVQCASIHKETEQIIRLNSNVKINIIFAVNEITDPQNFQVANAIAALYNQKGEKPAWEAMVNWYDEINQPIKKWLNGLGLTQEQLKNTEIMDNQSNWCIKYNIAYTPLILVNGYKINDMYEFSDLHPFLNQS